MKTDLPSRTGAEQVLAERIILVVLAVLRAGTLGLGAAETFGSGDFRYRWVVTVVLASLTGLSAITLVRSARRLRHGAAVVDDVTCALECSAAVAALIVMAYATPPGSRATSSFWVEPYTVVSAVILAGASRRVRLRVAGTVLISVTYLLCLLVVDQSGHGLSVADTATAWTNGLSYLPFFLIAAVGFAVIRAIVEQTEALGVALARLSAERARIATAGRAYRIGHDIPKALLREVRRATLSAGDLRPWVIRYRDDLQAALRYDRPEVVDLRNELAALSSAFAASVVLQVDLARLGGELPAGVPALLVVEATRELLNNASYHAYGYPATLRACSSSDAVEVVVTNGGPGVDPALLRSAWARKQNSIHHLEAAGGSYQVHSRPNSSEGTSVKLTWPAAT